MTQTTYENATIVVMVIVVGFITFSLGAAAGYRDGKQDAEAVCETIIKNNEQKQETNR